MNSLVHFFAPVFPLFKSVNGRQGKKVYGKLLPALKAEKKRIQGYHLACFKPRKTGIQELCCIDNKTE